MQSVILASDKVCLSTVGPAPVSRSVPPVQRPPPTTTSPPSAKDSPPESSAPLEEDTFPNHSHDSTLLLYSQVSEAVNYQIVP